MSANNENFSDSLARHMDGTPRLYHGTDAELNPGDIVQPASRVGKSPSADDVAYATHDLPTAKFMAWEQNNHNGRNFSGEETPPEHVYEVEPIEPTDVRTSKIRFFPAPDWKDSLGGDKVSTQTTSPSGFRVLSKVQHAGTISSFMKLAAHEKGRSSQELPELLAMAANKSTNREVRSLIHGAREKIKDRIASKRKGWNS